MSPYWAVFSARFRALLQYRAAALAGCGTQLFWGIIRTMIFWGFYSSTTTQQPMSYEQMRTYIWLGQATIILVFLGGDRDVAGMIRTGTVAYELVRPVNTYGLWFCRSLAARTAPLLLRIVPIAVIAALFLGLSGPASAACGGLWILSTVSAILLAAAVSTLLTVSLLWTLSGEGANRFLPALFYMLSGAILPLPLFPEWAQRVLLVLPFRGVMDTPFRIYMGHIPPQQAAGAILHQLAWAGGFVLLGGWLLSRGMRRVVVQGG